MTTTHRERVTIAFEFYATVPNDEMAADSYADEVASQLFDLVSGNPPVGVNAEDIVGVTDWTSLPWESE